MQIYQVMEFINKFTKSGSPVRDLSRFRRLMRTLGDPQKKLRFIHVAGTNGKGSVVRMIAETLTRAGYVTGEYTSPYIYRYNDRIKIDGKEIPDEYLCDIAEQVIPIIENGCETGYSQFEITTAIAFLYFAAMKCQAVVLETGLGGELDCTNIIDPPVCSVITSISFDHTAVLGSTLTEIALNKAGIIKDESPCILQNGNLPIVENVIRMRASDRFSRVIVPDERKLKIISSDITGNHFIYKGNEYFTSMPGRHQINNALTAIEALKASGEYYYIGEDDIFDGIEAASVPSRCQIIQKADPLIMIDGAHNPDGMEALADLVSSVKLSPKVLICGMLADKDWQQCADIISPCVDKVYCVDGFYKNEVFAPVLAEKFPDAEVSDLHEVYYKGTVRAGKGGMLVICGSLYLAAALSKHSRL